MSSRNPEVLHRVDEPADVVVGVLEEAGVHLHLAGEHGFQLVRHLGPRRDLHVPLRQLGVGRDDPELLLPREGPLTLRIPAVVESTRILVDPLARHVVRRWVAPGAK